MIHKISGPPGTGKTTALLNIVDRLLTEGVDPESILFTTFTRAGAYEARDRACQRFGLSPARLPFFKTLHSICYTQCGHMPVMRPSDWCSIASLIGVGFTLSRGDDTTLFRGPSKGDYMLGLWSYGRVNLWCLERTWNHRHELGMDYPNLSQAEFEHFVETVSDYKKIQGKIDYTDMLENFLKSGADTGCTHVILDEAQDFSLLQWAVCEKLYENAKQTFIAGDDDQAIHEWNGASPGRFIGFHGTSEEQLPQSYRIPASVHKLATSWVSRIKLRIRKVFEPRPEPGEVKWLNNAAHAPLFDEGTWLLLARNHSLLDQYETLCHHAGILYIGGKGGANSKAVSAVRTWRALRSGKLITTDEAITLYEHMASKDRIKHGGKTALQEKAKSQKLLSYRDLVEKYGLLAPQDLPWPTALSRMDPADRVYLETIELSGGIDKVPQIELSTIHGAKGREADHVVLMTDMSRKTHEAFLKNADAEHRVWYVGATRAKQRLFLIHPKTEFFYPA